MNKIIIDSKKKSKLFLKKNANPNVYNDFFFFCIFRNTDLSLEQHYFILTSIILFLKPCIKLKYNGTGSPTELSNLYYKCVL